LVTQSLTDLQTSSGDLRETESLVKPRLVRLSNLPSKGLLILLPKLTEEIMSGLTLEKRTEPGLGSNKEIIGMFLTS